MKRLTKKTAAGFLVALAIGISVYTCAGAFMHSAATCKTTKNAYACNTVTPNNIDPHPIIIID